MVISHACSNHALTTNLKLIDMIKYLIIVLLMNIAVISGIMYSFQYSAFYGFGLVVVIPAFSYIIRKA